ncbi:hypothetical protein F3Y22_tig00002919pilonHSYRG00225 [Hibiscus syriacus]|uniref:GTD-binding domain-containing protein n=1 Tax=Hibiscus syriacus TaxID=106335 RepID=A0A6A3CMC6_HIBSY|nr:hypothetical protein F3Y22_tig00002919pilonHSYRG00225 [Hibiscus syriacus]
MVATQFNLTVKAIQSDWGGEYRPLNTLLAKEGIATLPLKFRSYTVTTTIYLINGLPARVLQGASPFEKLFNRQPDYNFMKVFGCRCFPHLQIFQKHKFMFRSQQCTFIGYSPQHKGYQCLAADGRVYISRHVKFDELTFPFAELQPSRDLAKKNSFALDIIMQPQRLRVSMASSHGNTSPRLTFPFAELLTMPTGSSLQSAENQHASHSQASVAPSTTLTPDEEACHESHTPEQSVAEPVVAPEQSVADPVVVSQSNTEANTHPMCTRSKAGVFKPKVFLSNLDEAIPETVFEAFQYKKWSAAVHDEFNALQQNGTWTLVQLPEGRSAVGCKWLFKIKKNDDGTVQRHKARLVAKGYSQVPGQDFQETFSPMVRFSTINIILSLAVSKKWSLRQIDVNIEFLNGGLTEDEALYGLRQAPRNWHNKLRDSLLALGFRGSKADRSLFVTNQAGTRTFILVYVDDIILTGESLNHIKYVIRELNKQFSLKDLGDMSYFLGIEVKRNANSIILSQKKFLLDLLAKEKMTRANPTASPMFVANKLSNDEDHPLIDAYEFRSIVGSLLYICHTRPDVALSVSKVAQYMQAPREYHFMAVKRIIRYLAGTVDYGLLFSTAGSNLFITAFADADWGGDVDDRRSMSGHCVFLGKCLVSWLLRKQKTVSRSTMEAEYKSLVDAAAAAEVTWVNDVLADLGEDSNSTPTIWCDNSGVVAMSANSVYHAQSKHVDLDVHFVREKVAAKHLQVQYVPASHQIADGFTKPLAKGVSSSSYISGGETRSEIKDKFGPVAEIVDSLPVEREKGSNFTEKSTFIDTNEKSGFIGGEADRIRMLEQALQEEKAKLAAMYLELEKERAAAELASDETTAMILRLQKDKASIQMEARQYKRMEYHLLERELEAYRLGDKPEECEFNYTLSKEGQQPSIQLGIGAQEECGFWQPLDCNLQHPTSDLEPAIYDVHVVDDKVDIPEENSKESKKPPDSALDHKTSRYELRRTFSGVSNEMLAIGAAIKGLRERLQIVRGEKVKLTFSSDQSKMVDTHLKLIKELVNQLREFQQLKKPVKQASLPPLPSSSKACHFST